MGEAAAAAAAAADQIDRLLERYLHLLHEYTSLREQLSSLQTGMYQNIARANFAAERGMRFGRDHYDERMQASRRVAISTNDRDTPRFAIAPDEEEDLLVLLPPSPSSNSPTQQASAPDMGSEKAPVGSDLDVGREKREEKEEGEGKMNSAQKKRKDPLKWFGLLTPTALRHAQAQSIEAVEQVVPRLVSVNAEMAHVEIEVRRARKKRAKAEAAVMKKEQETVAGTEVRASS
ncbi:hypothetical protein F4779DRAFT_571171 [Xylariaceae sp. FL0662B]|nr:hypothetical protein F4779DRAFT_571171 [Xylariaceae sp. FL0662B]